MHLHCVIKQIEYSPDRWLVIPDFWLNFGVFSWKRLGKTRVTLGFERPLGSKEMENEPVTKEKSGTKIFYFLN